jgi:serine/threonine-protein kinase
VHAALARPAEERAVFLAEACSGDSDLQREAASLLERDGRAGQFLGTPLDALAAAAIFSAQGTPPMDQPRSLSGSRIGTYEIRERMGSGGMGIVYRARDTRLHRDVAVKVLLPAVTDDPDRLARFAREARILASLNHPHIAQIYGLEDSDGVSALVMELVEGPTLADRIARGAIPSEDALGIAKQIADALEAAHAQRIIHRDLKPANVKVRPDGTIKVLDFGLAKAVERPGAPAPGLSMSSPITTPDPTRAGLILGTAAYMSPEQARGQAVDARTDIWAFGVLLFEMLSGRRPFEGADLTEVLSAVLRSEPDWDALPPQVPSRIRHVIRACLQKDPRHRIAHIQDVRLALDGAFDGAASDAPSGHAAARRPVWQRLIPLTVLAMALGVVAGRQLRPSVVERAEVIRFSDSLPEPLRIRGRGHAVFAISPDGRRVVFNTTRGLYLRSMSEREGRLLAGSESPLSSPFFSADGQSVGYFQAGQLKRLAIGGGAPVAIAPATSPFGVTWTSDNSIFFGQPQGIVRVSASGGASELVVAAANGEQLDGPQLLPDGHSLLFSTSAPTAFSVANRWDSAQVVVQSLRTGARKVLLRNASDARYVHTGHLVYAVDDGLHAVRFDPTAHEVRGAPVSILVGVSRATGSASANYAVSRDGTLFHVVGTGAAGSDSLIWVDREGKANPIPTVRPSRFSAPRLSSDERRLLVLAEGDVRVYDLGTGRESRVTSDGTVGGFAAWRDDGTVAYTSTRSEPDGNTNVWIQPPGGTANATRLTALEGQLDVDSWSPDGRTLAVHHHKRDGGADVLMIPVGGKSSESLSFAIGRPVARNAVFSPDGRYVAYLSNETGQFEVYIRPFRGPGPKTPVSVGGARNLTWARNGELFYQRPEDNTTIAVPVATRPTLTVGLPKELFRFSGLLYGTSATTYAVSADGKRFLMTAKEREGPDTGPGVTIVLNWAEELKAKVP